MFTPSNGTEYKKEGNIPMIHSARCVEMYIIIYEGYSESNLSLF
jgi:hypothetical protein